MDNQHRTFYEWSKWSYCSGRMLARSTENPSFLSRFETIARAQLKCVLTNVGSQVFIINFFKFESKDPLVLGFSNAQSRRATKLDPTP
jgi:hypothetical protein